MPGSGSFSTVAAAGDTHDFDDLIARAWHRRAELAGDHDVYRVVHGAGDGLANVSIDRYGEHLWVEVPPSLVGAVEPLVGALDRNHRFEQVYARERRIHARPHPVRGRLPPSPVICREGPVQLALDFSRAGNPGLYLDARPARQWLYQNSSERRVLNLFAFTGSLGIAAALGGAASVTHIDNHPGALDWCRENNRLNHIASDERDYARLNIYQHLRKAQASRQRYDGIILDAPPGTETPGPKDRTPGKRGPDYLLPMCARMLAPGGWLLCFYHRDPRSEDRIVEAARSAAEVELEVLWSGTSGPDFPPAPATHPLRLIAYRRQ